MCQSCCRVRKMTDATINGPDELVREARGWSDALLSKVHQGPGDTVEAAMHRAEQKYGVPAQAFFGLRYNRIKDISAFVYLRLQQAYEHECARQEARLRHELAITKEMLGHAATENPAVAEAEAVLGAAQEGEAA